MHDPIIEVLNLASLRNSVFSGLYASFCPWPSLVRNVTFKLSLYLCERQRQQPEDVQYDYSSVLVRKHFLNGKKVS